VKHTACAPQQLPKWHIPSAAAGAASELLWAQQQAHSSSRKCTCYVANQCFSCGMMQQHSSPKPRVLLYTRPRGGGGHAGCPSPLPAARTCSCISRSAASSSAVSVLTFRSRACCRTCTRQTGCAHVRHSTARRGSAGRLQPESTCCGRREPAMPLLPPQAGICHSHQAC
jgi:hypothetical protein